MLTNSFWSRIFFRNSKGSRLVYQCVVLPVLQKLVIKTDTMLLVFISLAPQSFLEYYILFLLLFLKHSQVKIINRFGKLAFLEILPISVKTLEEPSSYRVPCLSLYFKQHNYIWKKISPRKLPNYERDTKDSNGQHWEPQHTETSMQLPPQPEFTTQRQVWTESCHLQQNINGQFNNDLLPFCQGIIC